MALYWLHVNKPSATATLHVEGGCRWVAKARARFLAGLPYSDTQGDRHGFWEGPFTTRASAETAQESTGYARRKRCPLGPCARLF